MKPGTISSSQLWAGVLGVLLVAAFYGFPRAVASATYTAAPWAILLAGIAVLLMLLPTLLALARRTGQNVMDLTIEAGGRPLGIVVALIFNGAILTLVGLSLRQASELVVTALFPHTPQTFAMAAMISVSAIGATMTPPAAFWVASLYVWPTLISILLLLVGSLGWGQLRNVTPVAGPGVLPTLWEVIPLTSHFSPLVNLLVFCGFLPTPRRLVGTAARSVAVAAVTWSLVILFYLMVFPLPASLQIPFPLFEMSRLVQGGRFLERVDSIWIIAWSFGSVLRAGLGLLAGAWLFRQAFRLPDHRGAVLPLAITSLAIALLPSNQFDAIEFESRTFRSVGYLIFFILPLLVTLLAWIRAKFGGGTRA